MHNPKATKSQLNAYIALQDTLILSLQTEVINNKSLLIETIIAIQRSAVRYAEEEIKKYSGY